MTQWLTGVIFINISNTLCLPVSYSCLFEDKVKKKRKDFGINLLRGPISDTRNIMSFDEKATVNSCTSSQITLLI